MQNVKKMHVKTGDTVMVRSGTYDKGHQGKVIERVSRRKARLSSRACTTFSKHVKPRKQGEAGGIIETSKARCTPRKVQLYCAEVPARARASQQQADLPNGEKIRACAQAAARRL